MNSLFGDFRNRKLREIAGLDETEKLE